MSDIIDKLNPMELDALKESANIGAGSASSTLSEIIGKKVNILLSKVGLFYIGDEAIPTLRQVFGNTDDLLIGIYNNISNDFLGNILVIFNKKCAMSLTNLLLNINDNPEREISDLDKVKLKEIGKVVSVSYIRSFNDFFGTTLAPSSDSDLVMVSKNMSVDLSKLGTYLNQRAAIMFKTHFAVDRTGIDGNFVLMLTLMSVDEIVMVVRSKLGIKAG